jgi:hypothetical protein
MNNSIILTCIVPFAPKGFTRDWILACNYLQQTVSSLLNSKDPRIAVVVVGHDYPGNFLTIDPRVRFLESNQPAPPQKLEKDPVLAIKDKLAIIKCGWDYAKQDLPSDYVMIMDSDDFLSAKVVGFLANSVSNPGYRITKGWVWNTGSRFTIEATESFNILCGSSVIVRADVAEMKFELKAISNSIPEYAALAYGNDKPCLLGNELHGFADKAMELNGLKTSDIPFRAGIYRVGNVNSHSRRTYKSHSLRFLLGRLRRLRFLTPSLRKEFALY